MNFKYFKSRLLSAALVVACAAMVSACDDDIDAGQPIDENPYETIYENNGFLRDAKTDKASNVVEFYEDSYETALKMGLTKAAGVSLTAQASFDAAYLATYNREHSTNFELYPAELVSFADNGLFTFSAQSHNAQIGLTITAGSAMEMDKTYVVPVAITMADKSITLKESERHCIYLVKDRRGLENCFKGDDLPKGFLYFETNDTNPLNVLSYELENGKLFWDVIVLFAANISYDGENARPYIHCNPTVSFLLDNNETYLQPLRKRGIKVLLGLLGSAGPAGLAQLSETGAKDFAKEIARYCEVYNLDGVNFDDEYSGAPDLSNPAFAPNEKEAGARLTYETKRIMPDKLVTVYNWGEMYGVATVDGVDADEWIDIVVNDYPAGSASPIGNMTRKKCSYLSMEFSPSPRGGNLTPSAATSMLNGGYGWFMGFATDPKRYPANFARLTGAETLYGSPLKAPSVFYKMYDPTPYVYPDDM